MNECGFALCRSAAIRGKNSGPRMATTKVLTVGVLVLVLVFVLIAVLVLTTTRRIIVAWIWDNVV